MKLIMRINTKINMIVAGVGIFFSIGLVLLMVSDIIMRYFFNKPYAFTFELTQLALVLIVFSFIPFTTSQLRHVSIEVLVERFSRNIKFYVNIGGELFGAILFFFIFKQSLSEGLQAHMFGSITGELEIPLYPFYFYVAFGALLSCFSMIVHTISPILLKGKRH